MSRRVVRLWGQFGAALVLLSGCGPAQTLSIGVNDYSTNVVYGGQRKPTPPPPAPQANVEPFFPSFITPPPPPPPPPTGPLSSPSSTPSPPAVACPAAPPSEFPAETAVVKIGKGPVAGVYTFRQTGHYIVGMAKSKPQATIAREVAEVVIDSTTGAITYDVIEKAGPTSTTTSYSVSQTTDSSAADGLFITHVVTTSPNGTDEFLPVGGAGPAGLRIMPLPALNGATWKSVATDPIHATSFQVDGTVANKVVVDACGTVLDSWPVTITGTITSATKSLTVNATYDIGTQFGGLVLASRVRITGTENGVPVSLDVTSTINSITPKLAS